jgi:PAS domain S-box-containing protein
MKDLQLQNARILIVDDQEANILFLEALLHEGSYRHWHSVRDPRAALAACTAFQPDLILLDLIMPGLDGFGVLEQLAPILAEQVYLPVLILTIDITPESRRRALAAGAKDFLAKPLDAIEVLLRVKNLLETRFLYLDLQRSADLRIREQASLIDQANDAFLVCDLNDRILFWNRGAEGIYGWPAAEILGRNAVEVLFSGCSRELADVNREVAATGQWSGELRQATRDGRAIMVASRWTLLYDGAGRPKSKLLISTDITEKKKTEEKLLRAQRMENIGRLAGGIAHDLNNILAPLTMGLDLLGTSCTDESSQSLLANLQTTVQRGADLVRQILTFARGLDGPRRPVQPGALVSELAGLLRETFPRSISIETSLPENLWMVNADPTQIHQVLTNLCVNARDAMPRGGCLRITAENGQRDEHQARAAEGPPTGAWVALHVEDTGTGIAAETLSRIFEPFYTTKEVGQGTGLGLSTARDIVRNHGGQIRVESAVGRGTRFSVYLPARAAPQAEAPEPERRELPAGRGEWVLVVDDEAFLLHVVRLTLTAAGYQVLTAQNGAEAVTLYTQRKDDIRVVLTDLMMPIMDGPAAIEALQRLNPKVRVIILTGLLTGAETAATLGPVVKAFLSKPYTVDALLTTVRCVLDARA